MEGRNTGPGSVGLKFGSQQRQSRVSVFCIHRNTLFLYGKHFMLGAGVARVCALVRVVA